MDNVDTRTSDVCVSVCDCVGDNGTHTGPHTLDQHTHTHTLIHTNPNLSQTHTHALTRKGVLVLKIMYSLTFAHLIAGVVARVSTNHVHTHTYIQKRILRYNFVYLCEYICI